MRSLSPRRRTAAGFTMVELMVTIGIVALLSALAVPTLRSVAEKSHIRAASLSLQNGLALARAEAVRLNTQVQFVLTASGWNIQLVDGTLLQQASGKEKATGVTITRTPSASNNVTFDAFGRKSAGLTRIDIAATNPTPSHRPMRIQLSTGGLARLCDPDPDLPHSDPKVCL